MDEVLDKRVNKKQFLHHVLNYIGYNPLLVGILIYGKGKIKIILPFFFPTSF